MRMIANGMIIKLIFGMPWRMASGFGRFPSLHNHASISFVSPGILSVDVFFVASIHKMTRDDTTFSAAAPVVWFDLCFFQPLQP